MAGAGFKGSMAKSKGEILLGGSDSEDEGALKINENYAGRYDRWRGQEEMMKFTSKYGSSALDSDEESSTDEDEDARELTADVEKQFFKTLACLKKGDPRIYDEKNKFFEKKENSEATTSKVKSPKEKPMFLRDYERKILLEKGGHISSDEEVFQDDDDERPLSPTFVQEQKTIRESFKGALKHDSDEESDGIGGLFMQKEKSKIEEEGEEDDYRQWLKGQKQELGDKEQEKDLGALKSYWNNPELDKGETFLRDYILNKRYLESDDRSKKRSYVEMAHDSDEGGFSGDEKEVEKMEQFEHKYNYRFEEPDQEFLKRYPRTMSGSLRQKDERRKLNREEVKERKEQEKEQKRQQLKQLKAIKRKEIEERLQKLKEVTGNADIEFGGMDFDRDFNPEEHDKKMQSLFNEEFYDAGGEEEEKPEFPDLDKELELENWDEYGDNDGGEGPSNLEAHCDDPDFNMDCDYNPNNNAFEREMLENQVGRKNKKKRSKLAELLAKKKPTYDGNNQEIDKYMDEYYGLDYEDMIGDQPCRFKYRPVVANSFGLTIEEILMADDKELNRWCSLKKTCQYRNEDQEWYDVKAYDRKANLEDLKRKILPSLFKHETEEQEESTATANEDGKKKRKKKKKKKKKAVSSTNQEAEPVSSTATTPVLSPKKNIQKLSPSNSNATPAANGAGKEKLKRKLADEKIDTPALSPKKIIQKKLPSDSVSTTVANGTGKKSKRRRVEQKNVSQRNAKKSFGNKNASNAKNSANSDLSDGRLKAYGINPKKFKNRMKYGKNE